MPGPITEISDLPLSTDPANFDARADVSWSQAAQAFKDINAFSISLAGGFTGTSTTSLAIGTGSKAFTTQAGLAFKVGQPVVAASASGPTNSMAGVVSAYNSTTGALTVQVASVSGSGTKTDWVISLLPSSTISAFISTLLDDADAAAARTTLGLGTVLTDRLLTLQPELKIVAYAQLSCAAAGGTVTSGKGVSRVVRNSGGNYSAYWGNGGVDAALPSTPICIVAPLDSDSAPYAESASASGVTVRGETKAAVARDNFSVTLMAFILV